MDLRNFEFYEDSGLALVGAPVTIYEGTLTHPPVTVVASTVTNGDGMWTAAGLSETPKDVKVAYSGITKWYKGMTRHGLSAMWHEEPPTFKHAATPGAVAAGTTKGYFKSDGQWYSKTGGTELRYHNTGTTITSTDIADGTIVNADINAAAAIAFSKLEAKVARMQTLVMGSDVNTSGTTQVEMSSGYHITHTAASAANKITLMAVFSIVYGVNEGATFAFWKDGTNWSAITGYLLPNAAAGGIFLATHCYSVAAGDTASHTYSPAWASAGAYQVDASGASVANGLFILLESAP